MGPCTSVPIGDAGTSGVMAGGQKTNSEFEDNLIEPTEGIAKVRDLEMSSTSSLSQILYPTIYLILLGIISVKARYVRFVPGVMKELVWKSVTIRTMGTQTANWASAATAGFYKPGM